jgi:hypothetical protein
MERMGMARSRAERGIGISGLLVVGEECVSGAILRCMVFFPLLLIHVYLSKVQY